MRLGKHAAIAVIALFCLFAAGCSNGSSEDPANVLSSAVQDLDVDPTGATTVLTFTRSGGLGAATVANFESDLGQTPIAVSRVGAVVTVQWDARVTPASQVRAIGLTNVSSTYTEVETSDDSAPTYSITDGIQTPGLGGDVIEVTFSGPRVLESDVETPGNWTLTVNSTVMSLTGSSFVFDEGTQVLTITLGTQANLHASFTLAGSGLRGVNDVLVSSAAVAGVASGDAVAPTLTSAVQNLTEDEFGRVVDFTFSEAMDPVFAVQLARYAVALPDLATSATQVGEDVIRVTFNNPIVPGVDNVTLNGVLDAHGNALPDGPTAITQPAPVANAFDGTPAATTVENLGGDLITVVTTQALDPDTAVDPASWTLEVDSVVIDLNAQTLTYDLLSKTLTIELDFDMTNGDSFEITGVAALDVDGEVFNLNSVSLVAGDATVPTLVSVVQNRSVDPSGKTLDVQFSEDVLITGAETTGNYVDSGAPALQTATLLAGLDTVRLVYDVAVIPGDVTLSVSGVLDLAGNTMTAANNVAITSTDTTAPAASTTAAASLAGANNDTLTVAFDDDLIESEIEDPANWSVESPITSAVSTVGATVVWNEGTRTAVLTFANGIDLQRGDDYRVSFSALRDLGGNTIGAANYDGDIDAETGLPEVHAVYLESSVADEVVVRFTEPCSNLDDLYDAGTNPTGTRYVLRDSGGVLRGAPLTATPLDDGLGVRLSFGFVVAASDTLDVLGVTDRTGNPLFPALLVPLETEDPNTPSLLLGSNLFTALSGEGNDTITIVFDKAMSPWTLLEPGNFTITGPGGAIDISTATMRSVSPTSVAIGLLGATGHNLQTGGSYDLSANNVWSSHGVQRTVADTELGIAAGGDALAPSVPIGAARKDPSDANSLLIFADESLDPTASAVAANYDLNGGTLAVSAQRVGPRVVRAVFGVAPTPGDTITITVTDLAGNTSGSISRTVAVADSVAPLVAAVSGVMADGWGGDFVDISFDEPVTTGALAPSNWNIASNGQNLSLADARFTYIGSTNTVRIALADGINLDSRGIVTVTVGGIEDFSGNTLTGPVVVNGTIGGDFLAPQLVGAFVNWRAAADGTRVDVLFDEDVLTSTALLTSAWSSSGGQTVLAVELLERDHYRLTLSAPLGLAHTVSVTGIEDPARNAAGLLTIDPAD